MKRTRPPLKDIMRITGLSRATIDRVLNGRSGVHSETQALVEAAVQKLSRGEASVPPPAASPAKPRKFRLVIQADEEFVQSVIEERDRLALEMPDLGVVLDVFPCRDMEDEQIALLISEHEDFDGVAILAKNVFPIIRAASSLRQSGFPVVTMNSDLDLSARHAFVGIDNRAAGQTAGFLMGRHLSHKENAEIAVLVQSLSYRCHEEREMGFRSILRQRFPSLNVIDVVTLDNSSRSTYESTKDLLTKCPEIDGIYNIAGGNFGLAQALEEGGRRGQTLFVAHEFHAVTEPLIRNDAVDYLITQDLRTLVLGTITQLLHICKGEPYIPSTLITPDLLCKYCLPS